MSPVRRLVLALLAAVLLVVAVGAGVVVVRRSGAGASTAVRQDRPGTVLLVPGYGGGVGGLEQLAARLRSVGRPGRIVTVVALPGDATGPIAAQAAALGAAATAAVAAGAPSVDVVGYSAGGVVARYWVARLGGARLARRVVTLGSPQHGTDVAALATALAPGACPAACQELAPDSALLAGLNRGDETPPGPRWVSIWSAQDQVVTPPSSAGLVGALDVVVQDLCPGRAVSHGQLPTDAAVQALVVAVLGASPRLPHVGPGCPVR